MKPKRWHRIEELYHSATALPGHERVAYFARACANVSDHSRGQAHGARAREWPLASCHFVEHNSKGK